MNITNYKYNVRMKNQKYDIRPKIYPHKNDSYINKLSYENDKIDYISDIRNINKFYSNNNYYKMKLLKKQKIKNIQNIHLSYFIFFSS